MVQTNICVLEVFDSHSKCWGEWTQSLFLILLDRRPRKERNLQIKWGYWQFSDIYHFSLSHCAYRYPRCEFSRKSIFHILVRREPTSHSTGSGRNESSRLEERIHLCKSRVELFEDAGHKFKEEVKELVFYLNGDGLEKAFNSIEVSHFSVLQIYICGYIEEGLLVAATLLHFLQILWLHKHRVHILKSPHIIDLKIPDSELHIPHIICSIDQDPS